VKTKVVTYSEVVKLLILQCVVDSQEPHPTDPRGLPLFQRVSSAHHQPSTSSLMAGRTAFDQLWRVDGSLPTRRQSMDHRRLAKQGHSGTLLHAGSADFLGMLYTLAHLLWSITRFQDHLRLVEVRNCMGTKKKDSVSGKTREG
jgi:hypothetical protein